MIPSLNISSLLCKVARWTLTPPIVIGTSLATGVIAPVLPTWKYTSSKTVAPFSGGNLWEIEYLGECSVSPNL